MWSKELGSKNQESLAFSFAHKWRSRGAIDRSAGQPCSESHIKPGEEGNNCHAYGLPGRAADEYFLPFLC